MTFFKHMYIICNSNCLHGSELVDVEQSVYFVSNHLLNEWCFLLIRLKVVPDSPAYVQKCFIF